MTGNRTSLRQAIVIVATTQDDQLTVAALLDTVSNLVGVDGVTLSVVADGGTEALRSALPAGIDVLTVNEGQDGVGATIADALDAHLARDFQRVLAVAGDVLVLPARIAATGLGALESADVVIGSTPRDGVYLVGVRCARGVEAIRASEGAARLSAVGLRASADRHGLVVRSMEPRTRLAEIDGDEARLSVVARAPELNPRLARLMRGES